MCLFHHYSPTFPVSVFSPLSLISPPTHPSYPVLCSSLSTFSPFSFSSFIHCCLTLSLVSLSLVSLVSHLSIVSLSLVPVWPPPAVPVKKSYAPPVRHNDDSSSDEGVVASAGLPALALAPGVLPPPRAMNPLALVPNANASSGGSSVNPPLKAAAGTLEGFLKSADTAARSTLSNTPVKNNTPLQVLVTFILSILLQPSLNILSTFS